MNPPDASQLSLQVVWLFVLALPVASIAWTVTHEEIFREIREYCQGESTQKKSHVLRRKFFYALTCEYCFSHWVCLAFLALTKYRLLLDDWRGYVIAFFALTAVANAYLSGFGRLRVDIKSERLDIAVKEEMVLRRPSGESPRARED